MKRLYGIWLICAMCFALFSGMGCGDPDKCTNDTQCSDGKICLHGKCSVKPSPDAGNKEEKTTPKDAGSEPTSEPIPEKPSVQDTAPDKTPKPDTKADPGTRKKGDVCDPRPKAHARDRCAPSLACAEVAQAVPSNLPPQPYGICMTACSAKDKTCPSGTVCRETLDTKTHQGTGIFVCADEAEEGDACVNINACKKGLSCIRFGKTGTFWICQKECTKDASACPSGTACKEIEKGSAIKICKATAAEKQVCSAYNECEDKTRCMSSSQSHYPAMCQKTCNPTGSDCPKGEACKTYQNSATKERFSVCMKLAKVGEECNHGYACETGGICLARSSVFASCYKRCSSTLDCPPNNACERYTSSSATKICQPPSPPGSTRIGFVTCSGNSRAITISSSLPPACLPDCSAANKQDTDKARCGNLGSGFMYTAYWSSDTEVMAFGQFGQVGKSSLKGATWERVSPPQHADYYGSAVSGDGKVALYVGSGSFVARTEDSGAKWSVVPPTWKAKETLFGVALSWDGKTAIAVGDKGLILRSEDGGKTWAVVTLSPAVTVKLNAVAIGRDKSGSSSVAVAVGEKGTALLSTDGGKTWSPIKITAMDTYSFLSVAIVRDPAAKGLHALIVGSKGIILQSSDEGKTWVKETSPTQNDLTGVAISGAKAVAVGLGATVIYTDQGKWVAGKTTAKNALYGVSMRGDNAVAVGTFGSVLYTSDAGKNWQSTSSALLACLGIRNSSGGKGGGVCVHKCDPKKKGADCPALLNSCISLRLTSGAMYVCAPGTFKGTRQKGEPCSISTYSALYMRCADGLSCVQASDNAYKCMQTCDPKKSTCGNGETCVYSNTLGNYFCGKKMNVGESCDWGKSQFCGLAGICKTNVLKNKKICHAAKLAKKYNHCISGVLPCEKGLVCSGRGETPYRNFCTTKCDTTDKSSCPTGWDCFRTSGTSGICVEACPNANYKCTVTNLRCTQFSAGKYHCI